MRYRRLLLGMSLALLPFSASADDALEVKAGELDSALARTQEQIRDAVRAVQPVDSPIVTAPPCQKTDDEKTILMDFSGKDGVSRNYLGADGENGENGKNVILTLKADPGITVLDVVASDADDPKRQVTLRLCLPLRSVLRLRSRGGHGARGGDGLCRYNDRDHRWDQELRPGDGGDGGKGGNAAVYYSHPELLKLLVTDTMGGYGGRGGNSTCLGSGGFDGRTGRDGKVTEIPGAPPNS